MPLSPRKRQSSREVPQQGTSSATALIAKNHSFKLLRGTVTLTLIYCCKHVLANEKQFTCFWCSANV